MMSSIRPLILAAVTIALSTFSLADPSPVIVVQGTISTPDPAERNYARVAAQNISHWLKEMAVPHRVIDDQAVVDGQLAGARVVVMAYNPSLPKKELTALRIFQQQGGKLVVFYSSDPRLAALLGMRLGDYKASEGRVGWQRMSFNQRAPSTIPKVVFQNSRNIRPVYPASKDARVIAHWQGGPTQDPAWIMSDRGAWMTHILLDDGDSWRKKLMLTGIIGVFDSSIWQPAAKHCFATAGRLGKYAGVGDATRDIRRQAKLSGRGADVDVAINTAVMVFDQIKALYDAGKYPEVAAKSRRLQALFTAAYAKAQPARTGEFRGVWDHSGLGLYPGDWTRTCQQLKQSGFSDLFVNFMWPGRAHYASQRLPSSDLVQQYGDQLKQCQKAAHKQGMRIHVWKICWRLDEAPASFVRRLKKENRLQMHDNGRTVEWLCPSDPRNITYELAAIAEVLRKYNPDGIHLDYIRYQSSHLCYCQGCRRRFEQERGKPVANWPAGVRHKGRVNVDYNKWRCRQIDEFVSKVHSLIRKENPKVKLSAAVYGKHPSCVASVAQDWPAWLKRDLVDFVVPMNYTSDQTAFRVLLRRQLRLPGAASRVFPGLGITARESRLNPVQVIDQIRILREEGAAGFVAYGLNNVLAQEILPTLKMGITRD